MRSGFRRPTLHPRSRAHGPECGPIQPAPYPHSGHPRVFASGRPDLVEIIVDAGVGRIARIGQVPEDRVLRAGEVIPPRRHARAVDPMVTRLHADRHPVGDGLALLNDVRGLGGDGGGEGHRGLGLVHRDADGQVIHRAGCGHLSHALVELTTGELGYVAISPTIQKELYTAVRLRLSLRPSLLEQGLPVCGVVAPHGSAAQRGGEANHARPLMGGVEGAVHRLVTGLLNQRLVGAIITDLHACFGQIAEQNAGVGVVPCAPAGGRFARSSLSQIIFEPQDEVIRADAAATTATAGDDTVAGVIDGVGRGNSHQTTRGEGRERRKRRNTPLQPTRLFLGRSGLVMLFVFQHISPKSNCIVKTAPSTRRNHRTAHDLLAPKRAITPRASPTPSERQALTRQHESNA